MAFAVGTGWLEGRIECRIGHLKSYWLMLVHVVVVAVMMVDNERLYLSMMLTFNNVRLIQCVLGFLWSVELLAKMHAPSLLLVYLLRLRERKMSDLMAMAIHDNTMLDELWWQTSNDFCLVQSGTYKYRNTFIISLFDCQTVFEIYWMPRNLRSSWECHTGWWNNDGNASGMRLDWPVVIAFSLSRLITRTFDVGLCQLYVHVAKHLRFRIRIKVYCTTLQENGNIHFAIAFQCFAVWICLIQLQAFAIINIHVHYVLK